MPERDFEYDAFLSHAGEDTVWCEELAERLRNEGVRVWFDKWELQPGDNVLAKINDGLAKSRKMIAVWSANYFRDGKVWTLVESFSQLHGDPLSQDRPIIPLLIEDCTILPTFRNILFIDFRNQADFDLRFRQLLQALDLPRREFEREPDFEFKDHDFEAAKRGRFAQKKGKRFEDEIAKLYELLGFSVKRDTQLHGFQIDLQIEKREGGFLTQAIVECKDKRLTADDRNQILAQQNLVQKKLPRFRWIAVSSQSFAADTRTALDEAGVDCTTYAELLRELVPLDHYVEGLITEYETEVAEKWRGEDWYIRPNLRTEITDEKQPALSHFAKWLGSDRSNFLVLLGDLGTGKSTLAKFLAYNLGLSFRADPLRHPAPVLIPLKGVRKENTLESMIISHFSKAGLPGINFSRFEHLVRLGKIILLFDAFDEMADRVRWEVTKSNFTELRRAAEQNGKVILTCRTHYFKDRNEQAKLIGVGPRLSEIETDLYRELKQQSGAEVVYLREFDDAQIKAYLHKARPQTATADWQKIQNIYNLKELAQRPLLLDMIVKSLPKLEAGQQINAASLYKIYTNIWIEREEAKGRILDKNVKMQLMHELAWRLWHETKDALHYRELAPFVEKLAAGKVIEFGDEEADDIAREMQAATFLKRDDTGYFSFVHRSFMEYFLARKIHEELVGTDGLRTHGVGARDGATLQILNTRRFDRKVIFFLTLLDEHDQIDISLKPTLTTGYLPNISENALQILYWCGRIRCGMEDEISSHQTLQREILTRIPSHSQLCSAKLQEIVLEGADLADADLSGADLTKANLNHCRLARVKLNSAKLNRVRAEFALIFESDFRQADIHGGEFHMASVKDCDFTQAQFEAPSFALAHVTNCTGLALAPKLRRENLQSIVQCGHAFGVNAVAYSADSDVVVSGGTDGLITLYRASNGKLLRVIEGHTHWVNSVHFSPDGEKLASGSIDKSVRLWEVKSGNILRVLEGHTFWVNSVHFSPDGEKLASGSGDKSVRLWEVKSGNMLQVLEGHTDGVNSLHFSPDGQTLASGSGDKSVRLWEVKSGNVLQVLEGHTDGVNSVHFSPDGQTLASGSSDKSVRLWEVKSGNVLQVLEGHTDGVNSVHFSPDGQILASGSSDQSVQVWEVKSGLMLWILRGLEGNVRSVHFLSGGEKLVSGGFDQSLRVWEVKSGKMLRRLPRGKGSIHAVHFSSDGQTLASAGNDNSVRLWGMKNDNIQRVLEGHQSCVTAVHFSPDGEILASGSDDKTVRLWDVKSGKTLQSLQGLKGHVRSVLFSPDKQVLASGSMRFTRRGVTEGGEVRLWEVKSGNILWVLGHEHEVWSLHFSPDGQVLASCGHSSIRLLEVRSGKLLREWEGHQGSPLSVCFSPNGQLLASGNFDKSVWLWDMKSEKMLRMLEGHHREVSLVQFSRDGLKLASGSDDHTVRLWEVETGKCLQVLEGHLGPVYTVCFSPNGKYLVAAGAAGRLQFWDFEKGETFLYRYAFGPGAWLDLLPDGRFDASPEGMRYLCYTEQGTLNSYTAEELVKEFYDPKAVQEVLEKYVR